ncbi:Unannotated [Lentimonas sp. CC4]|nr:Unannotated [Lentimonas sp. CC4]CAA6683803.1 Unannotated [Lentimonas sp. CC6]CAA7077800.1 Unannotated [Lentimonas sp. CC4]CAA7169732.1 Unannotated [Lentimonas sp. CC21]
MATYYQKMSKDGIRSQELVLGDETLTNVFAVALPSAATLMMPLGATEGRSHLVIEDSS